MKAQERRKIYISSLEEHIDALHNQVLSYSLFPVPFERLERMRGINSQTTIVSAEMSFMNLFDENSILVGDDRCHSARQG
jgi:hypothetical protein